MTSDFCQYSSKLKPMILLLGLYMMSTGTVHASYTEECNPVVKVQKVIDCDHPEKKCEVEFKVRCDAYPDWMNCKIQPGSTFTAHVKSFEKKPAVGSSWLFKYTLFCSKDKADCNTDLWAAVSTSECPASKSKKPKPNS